MKTRLLTFMGLLRDVGLPVTISEALDAFRAVRAVGIERESLRAGLAATLLKDQADRASFDLIFDRCFPLMGRARARGQHPEPAGVAGGRGPAKVQSPSAPAAERRAEDEVPQQLRDLHGRELREKDIAPGTIAFRHRRLRDLAFDKMSPDDVEECDALVAELSRRFRTYLSRRVRAARRECLDMRRTIRRSIATGGVPIDPAFRRRRPSSRDLIILCDASHSVASATRFLIGLLQPAKQFFRRVRLFAYVDCAIESTIEAGRLIPHEHLDLYGRSDFGRVLVSFWDRYAPLMNRNTVVLILGDARNNRRPARADLLAAVRSTVRRVVWLNPEGRERWNTGDSVMRIYERQCDDVLVAATIRKLHAALRRTFTRF